MIGGPILGLTVAFAVSLAMWAGIVAAVWWIA